MLAWLYRVLFARRVKWVVVHDGGGGTRSRVRFMLYDPTPEEIAEIEEENIRPLEELGWVVLCRPRRCP